MVLTPSQERAEEAATLALISLYLSVAQDQMKLTARQALAISVSGFLVASHHPSEAPQAPILEDLAPL